MNWKTTLKSSLPFVIGVLVGGGFSRNRYVWLILIFYVLMIFSLRLFAGKAQNIKKSADKKIALRNAGMDAVNNAADYIAEGNNTGAMIFDKWFPKLSVLIGMSMVFYMGFLFYYRQWFFGFIMLFAIFVYIALNNIWKKVKYLGDDTNG